MHNFTPIILAAGFGSRINNVSNNPKCLLKVNKKAIIEYTLENLISRGINEVVIIVGYKKELVVKKLGPANAIYYSIKETLFLCKWTSIHIWHLISGKGDVNNLSGPLGVAKVTGEVAKSGLLPLINFMAFISISLGFINLLPIPVLDGGHIMFFSLEKIS